MALHRVIERRLVTGERPVPERVELVPQGANARRVEPVDVAATDGLLGDEAGVLQYLQVLRNGWPTDWKALGEIDNGERLIREALEDRPPSAIGEDVPGVVS